MIIGVDVGYGYTKTSEGIIFPSKISERDETLTEAIKIRMGGKDLTVGVGNGTIELNKVKSEITNVCLTTALALSDDYEFKVVTGLPIAQYFTQKDEFRESILQNRINFVTINGNDKTIRIKDVKIYAQGAGALYTLNASGSCLICDVGSRTVDIAAFECDGAKRRLSGYSTLYCGMIQLYSKIVDEVNRKYTLSLTTKDGEKILRDGLYIDGEKQSRAFLQPIEDEHLQEIVDELLLKYQARTSQIYIVGGGAKLIGGYIAKRFPNASIIDDCQFSNAKGFKKLGGLLWNS